MTVRICWQKGDFFDSIILKAETFKKLARKARAEIKRHEPVDNYWSEIINDSTK